MWLDWRKKKITQDLSAMFLIQMLFLLISGTLTYRTMKEV